MKKSNQQSKSDWGGKRPGAGAPLGNTNAVKHGERSRRAFFPLRGVERLPVLTGVRARNLITAEQVRDMRQEGRYFSGTPVDWREQILLDGIMWQHTKRIARIELDNVKTALALASLGKAQAKATLRLAQEEDAALRSSLRGEQTPDKGVKPCYQMNRKHFSMP